MISIIVPVRDDPRIDDLLATLAGQIAAPAHEVVVALDGARREPRVPAGMPVRFVRLPPRGPYAARNAAARVAHGEILLFTDSDCLCRPDWLARAAREFEDPSLAALQGGSVPIGASRLSRLIQLEFDRYVASHAATGYRRFCNTRNFGIRSEIVRTLPLPERLPRGGDGVYGWNLERAGIPIRYEPDWCVGHRHPTSRWDEGRRAFAQGRDGALWGRLLGFDLFSTAGETPRGPGAWLLSRTRGRPRASRAFSLALLPAATLFAAGSALLPGHAGERAFSRFCRASRLAGRLAGEAKAVES